MLGTEVIKYWECKSENEKPRFIISIPNDGSRICEAISQEEAQDLLRELKFHLDPPPNHGGCEATRLEGE